MSFVLLTRRDHRTEEKDTSVRQTLEKEKKNIIARQKRLYGYNGLSIHGGHGHCGLIHFYNSLTTSAPLEIRIVPSGIPCGLDVIAAIKNLFLHA